MDISIKVIDDANEPQLKISAVVGSAKEAAHLINVIKVNSDMIFDEEVVYPDTTCMKDA